MNSYGIKPVVLGEPVALTVWENGHVRLIHPYSAFPNVPIKIDTDAIEKQESEMGEPYVFLGAVVGDGLGEGAAAKLAQRYLVISIVMRDDKVCADPLTIEELLPDLDNVIVAPALARRPTREEAEAKIETLVQKCGEQDPLFGVDFGVTGAGNGVEIVPLLTMPQSEYEPLRSEHLVDGSI